MARTCEGPGTSRPSRALHWIASATFEVYVRIHAGRSNRNVCTFWQSLKDETESVSHNVWPTFIDNNLLILALACFNHDQHKCEGRGYPQPRLGTDDPTGSRKKGARAASSVSLAQTVSNSDSDNDSQTSTDN